MARGKIDPQALFARALKAYQDGDLERARRDAGKLTKIAPREAGAWRLCGAIAQARAESRDAARAWRRVVDLAPDDGDAWGQLGAAFAEQREWRKAVRAYEASLKHRPDHINTLVNHGTALSNLDDHERALVSFEAAARLAPDDFDARLSCASSLIQLRRFDEALAALDAMMAVFPNSAEVLQSLAAVKMEFDQVDIARELQQRAHELAPDNESITAKLSVYLLQEGRWAKGWDAYEARWAVPGAGAPRPFPHPVWMGEALEGASILVWGEQGVGDEIMFASMFPDLVARGASVIVECDPRLAPVFRRSFAEVKIVERAERPAKALRDGSFDWQIAAGSLARILRRDDAAFGNGAAYLKADETRARQLRDRYVEGTSDKLMGIAWRSANPTIGDVKSMALNQLKPILEIPGWRFVDLQYGDTAEERRALPEGVGDKLIHDAEIDAMVDFDDHLAQVAACDLIVSISNTTAHAAGALGVPAWTMLRHAPDRRWLMERTDSPWYASVRLFRQPSPGDWASVIDAIKASIEKSSF